MAPPERIQDQIKNRPDIEVEYGVPLESLPYKRILKLIDDLSGDEKIVSRIAARRVEDKAKEGKFGAFVTKRFDFEVGAEIVEVWSSDSD